MCYYYDLKYFETAPIIFPDTCSSNTDKVFNPLWLIVYFAILNIKKLWRCLFDCHRCVFTAFAHCFSTLLEFVQFVKFSTCACSIILLTVVFVALVRFQVKEFVRLVFWNWKCLFDCHPHLYLDPDHLTLSQLATCMYLRMNWGLSHGTTLLYGLDNNASGVTVLQCHQHGYHIKQRHRQIPYCMELVKTTNNYDD